ncbi:hypothetical protein [Streptomyces sp. NPDC092307]|uniref:hypothetical protein n=1 Tax=Streptomyces sp. NPDC092307 TaxID=3366013 RepID=UPI003808AD99
MSSSAALAAHLEWEPFAHRPDCAGPVWEVDHQISSDKLRPRCGGPEHTCPNEECGRRALPEGRSGPPSGTRSTT